LPREDHDVLESWLALLAIASLVATWHHVLRLRERATTHARRICQEHGVQLLDDSVALHRLRFGWRRGVLQVTREYRFDTSRDGHDRNSASMTVLGDRIVGTHLPVPESTLPATATPTCVFRGMPSAGKGQHQSDNVISIGHGRRTLQ
jgi:hypothetical protein